MSMSSRFYIVFVICFTFVVFSLLDPMHAVMPDPLNIYEGTPKLTDDDRQRLRDDVPMAAQVYEYLCQNTSVLGVEDYISLARYKYVVDYAKHEDVRTVLPKCFSPEWGWLGAFLPEVDPFAARSYGLTTENEFTWAQPTELRLKTLWTSNNVFDVQLLLRLGSMMQVMPDVPLIEMIGNTIGMARRTFLMLPCGPNVTIGDVRLGNEASREEQEKAVWAAIDWVLAQKYVMGIRELNASVAAIVDLSVGGCKRSLFEIVVQRMVKGTRHTWCFYVGSRHKEGPWVKFAITYAPNTDTPVVLKQDNPNTVFQHHSKVIRDYMPNINMGDLIGWGVTMKQRMLLFWDLQLEPAWSDYNMHNFLISHRGRVLRIDKETKTAKRYPMGLHYYSRPRRFICLVSTLSAVEEKCPGCKKSKLTNRLSRSKGTGRHQACHACVRDKLFANNTNARLSPVLEPFQHCYHPSPKWEIPHTEPWVISPYFCGPGKEKPKLRDGEDFR